MASPYAKSRGGGSAYAQNRGSGGSRYSTPRGGGAPAPMPKKSTGGGFLHGVGHFFSQGGADLKDAALHAPGGVVKIGETAYEQVVRGEGSPFHRKNDPKSPLTDLAIDTGKQIGRDLRHPLRHPGNTALDVLPFVNVAGKLGEAGALAKRGGSVRDVAKAATVGAKPGPRVLNINGMEVRGHYSRAAGSRVVQKGVDKALQKGAEMPTRTGVRVENLLHRRAAKWEQRNQRVADATARAPGTRLAVLGQKLKPEELRALRLVAEETPVARRLGAQEMRKARATGKEVGRHQERIDVTKKALAFLDEHPTTGAPVFKPGATKLRNVYKQLQAVSSNREGILKNLGLMDEQALQAAKTKTGRVTLGEPRHNGELPLSYDQGGIETASETALRSRLDKLDAGYRKFVESAMGAKPGDYKATTGIQNARNAKAAGRGRPAEYSTVKEQLFAQAEQGIQDTIRRNPEHPAVKALQGRLDEADAIRAELARRGDVSIGLAKGREGAAPAALFEASPNAVHIGNPVETKRISGNPKVSSTGTFGHTRKPTSLRTATGGSIEHALERGDVTQIVSERHSEAVRLAKIDRVRMSVAKAGEAAPRRPDDVFVWTDKLTKNERIPAEVKKYLENPDSIAALPPDEQLSIGEKLKQAVFEQQDWRDPSKVAEFQKLAAQGKGVFVPRRLLGAAAKKDYSLGHFPGMSFVDAVNNAQKAGLVYLKLNYPVVQGVSNVAMNLIQGAFNPVHISQAIKVFHADPELYAVAKDIMGEGAIPQASLVGTGAIARGSQKLARVMSSKVDTPARLLAFYYEAARAGYGGAKMRGLVFDEKNAGDLAEVAQRAKEAIVDFGEQSPFEKSVMKRLIFVYPWQKGATKYAGHFLRDHPVQAAALGQAAQLGKQQSDQTFGPVPSYLEGLIGVDGRAVNPAGVNFFQTPAQIGEAVGGLATGNPAQRGAGLGFLAPAPGVLAGLLSGHDDIGRPLTSNVAGNIRDLTYGQTPVAQMARAAAGGNDLVRKVAGSRTSSKTFPNPSDAFWRFLLGGLYPRQYDKGALNQNAARQKTGR